MTTGKRATQTRSPSPADAAARVLAIVSGEDPAAQKALSERHLARARKTKPAKSAKVVAAPPRDLSAYLRPLPTRSRVLNAFLHESGGSLLVSSPIDLLDEHALAPLLVEIARKYLAPMAAATGNAELALRLLEDLPSVTGEQAARLVVRRALTDPGPLGVIARDYDQHRLRAGAPPHDDLLGSAMLAAFAGRVIAYAERLIGLRVRDEVQESLRRLLGARPEPSSADASARRAPVRVPGVPKNGDRDYKKRGTA